MPQAGRSSGLRLDKVIFLILNLVFNPSALGPGVYSASDKNEYQKQKRIMFLGSKVRPMRRTDSLTAICELIVWKMWDPEHITTL
jgi:hypothetical protein